MLSRIKSMGLASQILIAMVIGAILGYIFQGSHDAWGAFTTPIGEVFLRLLRMTIMPLIFFSIISGVAGVADMRNLKRIGTTFLTYWVVASALAAVSGVVWSYIIKPGEGMSFADQGYTTGDVSIVQSLVHWVPDNVFASFAEFNILQVIVFSLLLGITVAMMPDSIVAKKPLQKFFEYGNIAITKLVELVMYTAPLGVFCLMADVTGTLGTEVLTGLGKMLITQYVAYLTLIVVVFPVILKFLAKVSPIQHFKNIYPAMVLAFSTCSSSATLPLTMKCTKERAGVPAPIVDLVAPPAATINMQACCAEMPIYAVFAAQMFGINLGILDLAIICLLGVIMAAGVAGVPGGGILMSAIMMQSMGLPLTIVPWVAGIYRLIDMPNTMLNVTGDTVGMVTTAAMLGELDRETFNAPN